MEEGERAHRSGESVPNSLRSKKLSLTYFGHIMGWLEKMITLGKTEGRRKWGSIMRWTGSLKETTGLNLQELTRGSQGRTIWRLLIYGIAVGQRIACVFQSISVEFVKQATALPAVLDASEAYWVWEESQKLFWGIVLFYFCLWWKCSPKLLHTVGNRSLAFLKMTSNSSHISIYAGKYWRKPRIEAFRIWVFYRRSPHDCWEARPWEFSRVKLYIVLKDENGFMNPLPGFQKFSILR